MLEEICFRFPNGPSLGAFLPLGWTFPRVATLDQGKSMATLSMVLLSFGVPNRILANIGCFPANGLDNDAGKSTTKGNEGIPDYER